MLRRALTLIVIIGLVGCGGRTPANNGQDDAGTAADGPYLVDDAGNLILDDAGNPIPVQQDAAGQDDGPVTPPQDAGQQDDTGSTPGIIQCGQTTCDATTQQCCVTGGGGGVTTECIDITAECAGLDITCDGPEDCPTDVPICCARFGGGGGGSGVTCTDDCRGETLCRLDADCGTGEKCCGGASYGGMTYTWCELEEDCPNTNPTVGVPCGDTSCTASGEVCCVTYTSQSCTTDCQQGLSLACDGPEDCPVEAPVCCGDIGMGGGGSECVADGECQGGMGTGVVCHADADCPDDETCNDVPMVDLRLCGGF